jgi:hypothetical protein
MRWRRQRREDAARPLIGTRPCKAVRLVGLCASAPFRTPQLEKRRLAANLDITAAVQDGSAKQLLLLPFPEQQQQALRDAYITDGNAYELADGLGTGLSRAYWSLTTFQSSDDGKTSTFTNLSPAVALLISYTNRTTRSDSNSAYFFGNGTTDGKTAVSVEAAAIMADAKGAPDIFGRAYDHPAGSSGADVYGDSRPFQTEPHLTLISGKDFFGIQSSRGSPSRLGQHDDIEGKSRCEDLQAYTLVAPSLMSWCCPKMTYTRTPNIRIAAVNVIGNRRATRYSGRSAR